MERGRFPPPTPSWVLMVPLALVVAGCVAPTGADPPRLTFGLESGAEVPQDGVLTTNVSITITSRRALEVESAQDCLRVEVFARVAIPVVLEEDDPDPCRERATTHTVRPGATRTFGPFRLVPAEYIVQDGPLFTPGSYELVARFLGEPSWDTEGTTTFQVTPAEDLPRIVIEPEETQWIAGEDTKIVATFTNTAARAFTYTSDDDCNDIEVRVLDARGEGEHTRLWGEDGPYDCAPGDTEFTIAPGGSATMEVIWDGGENGHGTPYVPEGVWVLEARFGGTDHSWDALAREPVSILNPDE